jgi:heme exporter protein A
MTAEIPLTAADAAAGAATAKGASAPAGLSASEEASGPAVSSVSDPAIAAEGLVRRYGEREALAGADFALGTGETLAVFGPNGAGKTTLLRVLATLLLPHGGSVRVLGCDLPRQAGAVRPRIGMLAHEALLYRDLTGRENLDFYARLYEVPERERRIAEVLDAVGMGGRADEPLRSLSRGMTQRLAVCRAVLHSPELLLLDEPWSHLDPDAEELVEALVGRRTGLTRVLVSHDLERGLAEADRVLALRAGRVEIEAPANGLSPADLRPVYAGAR